MRSRIGTSKTTYCEICKVHTGYKTAKESERKLISMLGSLMYAKSKSLCNKGVKI